MKFKDYYAALGLDENASQAEIKSAYRKLARKFHPDVSGDAATEEKFKQVNEAYKVLKDKEKRAEYDALRKMGARGSGGNFKPPPNWESANHFAGFDNDHEGEFSDFFSTIFGGQGHSRRQYGPHGQQGFPMRGEDLHVKVSLLLEEAYRGTEYALKLQLPEADQHGLLSHKLKTIKVKIPAGTTAEKPLRLKGQGGLGIGGAENGDLFLDIQIAAHPRFSLNGRDLVTQVDLLPWQAALGGKVNLPTLDGEILLRIPANSQAKKKLRLKNKGFPGGDLYVELNIVMPKNCNDRMKELFAQLETEYEQCAETI